MKTVPQHSVPTLTCSSEYEDDNGNLHIITWGFEDGNAELELLCTNEED